METLRNIFNIDREKLNRIIKAVEFIDSIVECYEHSEGEYYEYNECYDNGFFDESHKIDYNIGTFSKIDAQSFVKEILEKRYYSEKYIKENLFLINEHKQRINENLNYLNNFFKTNSSCLNESINEERISVFRIKQILLNGIKKMNDLKSILYDDFSYLESTKELIKNLELMTIENAELDNENRILRGKISKYEESNGSD
jgi:hypothetical protein